MLSDDIGASSILLPSGRRPSNDGPRDYFLRYLPAQLYIQLEYQKWRERERKRQQQILSIRWKKKIYLGCAPCTGDFVDTGNHITRTLACGSKGKGKNMCFPLSSLFAEFATAPRLPGIDSVVCPFLLFHLSLSLSPVPSSGTLSLFVIPQFSLAWVSMVI